MANLMKRNFQYIVFFFLFSGSLYPSKISAQNSIYPEQDTVKSDKPLTWVNLGIGGLAPGFDGFLDFGGYGQVGGSISLSFQNRKHVISIKSIYYAVEVMGADKLSSIEITYGLIHKRPVWYCSLSSGINITWYKELSYWNSNTGTFDINNSYNKAGVPLDLQLFLTSKWLGIGIDGFLVFGSQFTTYGALLCLQIGKLR